MSTNNRNFITGNKKFSDLVLRITYECCLLAENPAEFADNLNTAMSRINGGTTLQEDRNAVVRTYNFLALKNHADLKKGCVDVFERLGSDPAAIVKQFEAVVIMMQEPKKGRKPRADSDDEDAPKKGSPKEVDEAEEADVEEEKPAPKKVVLPPKKGSSLPKPVV